MLSQTSNAALNEDVVKLMNEAVSVADDSQWINSRRPAFTWASEAKAACGKAYGYLQADYRDDDYTQQVRVLSRPHGPVHELTARMGRLAPPGVALSVFYGLCCSDSLQVASLRQDRMRSKA